MRPSDKLGGEVEVDETFIGGKARNMHLDVKQRRITGTGGKDKTIVYGHPWSVADMFAHRSSPRPQEACSASRR